jgi:hypothetical protein
MRRRVPAILIQLSEMSLTFSGSVLIFGRRFAIDMVLVGELMEALFVFAEFRLL